VDYPQTFADDMTGMFTTASFQLSDPGMTSVSLPFTYSGVVKGYLVDPFVGGFTDPVFTKTLIGSGTASASFFFDNSEGPIFTAHDLRYDFGDTAPVPQPATLLLSGVGSAVIALRRRLKAG
jgi:hypothetical protein